eukprot:scaffold3775_cov182-Pinguiococcus_pyrenoidosus.AAC.5
MGQVLEASLSWVRTRSLAFGATVVRAPSGRCWRRALRAKQGGIEQPAGSGADHDVSSDCCQRRAQTPPSSPSFRAKSNPAKPLNHDSRSLPLVGDRLRDA